MALYPEHVIREVGRSNDIVELASLYVKLKRSGGGMVGLCPFHREKTPSFHISPEEQLFYCFGCGAGGTIFDFVMRTENLDFVDAVKFLADRAQIALPEPGEDGRKNAESFSLKQKILKMNVLAARFFHENFRSEGALVAKKYVEARGLLPGTITKFGIGYAMDSWDMLTKHLKENGFSEDEITAAGLAVRNPDKNRVYDKFRGRLMFPIIDVRGNVIAFGGRVIGDGMPKYMNSPDTPVFNKSFNLFNLNLAKSESKQNGLILAEGYMDVISMHQNGITNSVATLGTSLTAEQAKLIKKYSGDVTICYDADNAGISAAVRAGEILAAAGSKVKVMTVVGAKDPDEFIKNKGVLRFKTLIENAKPYIKYRIDGIKDQYDLNDITAKVEFTNEAASVLSGIENGIERDAYIKEIAYQTGISADAIAAQVKKLVYQSSKREETKALLKVQRQAVAVPKDAKAPDNALKGAAMRLERSEKMLIGLMAKNKNIFKVVQDKLGFDGFSNELLNQTARMIKSEFEHNERIESYIIVSRFSGEDAAYVTSALYQDAEFDDKMRAAEQLITAITEGRDSIKIQELIREGNVEELDILLRKKKNN